VIDTDILFTIMSLVGKNKAKYSIGRKKGKYKKSKQVLRSIIQETDLEFNQEKAVKKKEIRMSKKKKKTYYRSKSLGIKVNKRIRAIKAKKRRGPIVESYGLNQKKLATEAYLGLNPTAYNVKGAGPIFVPLEVKIDTPLRYKSIRIQNVKVTIESSVMNGSFILGCPVSAFLLFTGDKTYETRHKCCYIDRQTYRICSNNSKFLYWALKGKQRTLSKESHIYTITRIGGQVLKIIPKLNAIIQLDRIFITKRLLGLYQSFTNQTGFYSDISSDKYSQYKQLYQASLQTTEKADYSLPSSSGDISRKRKRAEGQTPTRLVKSKTLPQLMSESTALPPTPTIQKEGLTQEELELEKNILDDKTMTLEKRINRLNPDLVMLDKNELDFLTQEERSIVETSDQFNEFFYSVVEGIVINSIIKYNILVKHTII